MADPFVISGPGRFPVPAVGTSNYVPALLAAAGVEEGSGQLDAELLVRIAAEPENPHDPRAVALRSASGATLAYLPREDATDYHDVLLALEARHGPLFATARMGGSGGGGRPWRIGVRLDLPGPRALSQL
ncbi:MAG: hypothetical protein JWM31_128 [Solirubrobacterales bacterium]|nr:hypothetical protein [Solirubrobacterales bacterium]